MKVPILLYHSIARSVPLRFQRWALHPDDFTAQMVLLSRLGFTPIQVSQFATVLLDHSQALPERPVLITFDDGLADFYTNALPVLTRYSFAATLFVTTAFIGGTSSWLGRYGASTYPMLNWQQISEIAASGIEIGAHGHTHVQLDTLPLPKATEEIVRSQVILEEHLGVKVLSFAYPHGYSSLEVRRLLPQAGFSSAVAVKNAMSSLDDNRFALARIPITPSVDLNRFSSLLEGRGLRISSDREGLQTKAWRVMRRSYSLLKQHIIPRQV